MAMKGKYNQMVSCVVNVGLSFNQVKQDNTNTCLTGATILEYRKKRNYDPTSYKLFIMNKIVRPVEEMITHKYFALFSDWRVWCLN